MIKIKRIIIKKRVINLLVAIYSFVIVVVSSVSCSNVNDINNLPIIGDSNYEDNFIGANDFFPQLYSEDYYDYVEFDDKSKPVIGDKFIMKVINDVITRVSSSSGLIEFYVDILSNQMIDFHFRWTYGDIFLSKIYSFNITNAL
ncbi:MHO_1590 family protein [Metamycoplasma sualvi]|uniref:MHO_1590 family protein n=1 Tax=Metamycoplasma sualvi TaxID=2125 RepID=UPI0038730253